LFLSSVTDRELKRGLGLTLTHVPFYVSSLLWQREEREDQIKERRREFRSCRRGRGPRRRRLTKQSIATTLKERFKSEKEWRGGSRKRETTWRREILNLD